MENTEKNHSSSNELRGTRCIMDRLDVNYVIATILYLSHSCANNVGPLQRVEAKRFYVCQRCNAIVKAKGSWTEGEREGANLF